MVSRKLWTHLIRCTAAPRGVDPWRLVAWLRLAPAVANAIAAATGQRVGTLPIEPALFA